MREGFPTVSVIATKRFLANKREVAKRFLRGIGEAVYIFKTDRERSLKTLSKWMRTTDREVLEDTYQSHASNMSFPPFTDLSGVQAVLDFLERTRPETAKRNPQDFVEEKVLKELEAEGFFNTVQKR